MRCPRCGGEMNSEEQECRTCKETVGDVKVLSRDERESFDGVTLDCDSDGKTRQEYRQYENSGPQHRVFVRQMSFGSGRTSIWAKLILALGLGLLVFVVLPIAFFAIIGIGILWMLLRLFRG